MVIKGNLLKDICLFCHSTVKAQPVLTKPIVETSYTIALS